MTEHLPAGPSVHPDLLATFQTFWREGYVALKLNPFLEEVREEEAASFGQDDKNTLVNNNFLFVNADSCQQVKDLCFRALGWK